MISFGKNFTMMICDGKLMAVGSNKYGQLGIGNYESQNKFICVNVENHVIKQIACGDDFSYILTENGLLYSTGNNFYGQLGFGHERDTNKFSYVHVSEIPIKKIWCGSKFVYCITDDNDIYACGENYHGQLGLNHNKNTDVFERVIFDKKTKLIDIVINDESVYFFCDDSVYACGKNAYGEFGCGTCKDSWIPIETGIVRDRDYDVI